MSEFQGYYEQANTSLVRQGIQKYDDNSSLIPGHFAADPEDGADIRGLILRREGGTGVADIHGTWGKDAGGTRAFRRQLGLGTDVLVVANPAVVALSNSATTAQAIFPAAQDTLTVEADTSYLMLGSIGFNTGATDHITSLGFALTTATVAAVKYVSDTISSAAATLATPQRKRIETVAATAVAATSTAVQTDITLRGFIRFTLGGTIVPQVTFSAGPTGTCETDADSFLALIRVGSAAFAAVGPFA